MIFVSCRVPIDYVRQCSISLNLFVIHFRMNSPESYSHMLCQDADLKAVFSAVPISEYRVTLSFELFLLSL